MATRSEKNALFGLVRNFLLVYLPIHRGLSDTTIRTYSQSLKRFFGYLSDVEKIRFEKVRLDHFSRSTIWDFLVWLRDDQGCSAQTLNLRLSALKSFLRYCGEQDITFISLYVDVSAIHTFKERQGKKVDYLTPDQLKLLFSTPDISTRLGRRDRFFMIFAYETGARMQELLNLMCKDVISTEGYRAVTITGKGNKIRTVPLMPDATAHLDAYLAEFHPSGDPKEWLFYTRHGGVQTQMKPGAVEHFLKKYARIAHEIDASFPKRLHAHMLRHSVAMAMYKNGVPISYVRDFLGHKSIDTTSIYSYADAETIRRSLEMVAHEPAHANKKWKLKEQNLMEYCGLM